MMSYCSLFYCEEHDELSLITIVVYVMIDQKLRKCADCFVLLRMAKK